MTIDSTIEPPRDAGSPSSTDVDGLRLSGLDRLGNGRQGTVFALHGPREECRRLQELWLVAGTVVGVERVAPLGDPMVIELRGAIARARADGACGGCTGCPSDER